MSLRIRCAQALTPAGWREDLTLVIDGSGMIESMEDDVAAAPDHDLPGVVIPGMPNLHSHGFQRAVAGLGGRRAGNDSFWTWREAMYRIANRVTPEQLYACMAGVQLEMLCGGYTSCAEFHYLHHGPGGEPYADPAELAAQVVRAADATGLGLTLLPVLYCRSGPDRDGVEPGQRRFHNEPDDFSRLLDRCRKLTEASPLWRTGVAPHSLRAVGPEELATLLEMRNGDEPVHVHVAEQPAEVEACLRHLGARPLAWLLANCDVDRRWCLVHATHLEEEERSAGAASGAVAGLCPTTEADLGDGIFGATDWLQTGGAFGVGSDSNLRLCAAEELRLLEWSQRLRDGARNLLADATHGNGRLLWERAARGGARALAQPVGRIEVGRRADLVELDPGHPMLAGLERDALLDGYVFAGGPGMIDSVWVGGERRVQRGRHGEGRTIIAAYRRALEDLRS